jgi:hypothetical protein
MANALQVQGWLLKRYESEDCACWAEARYHAIVGSLLASGSGSEKSDCW